MNLGPPLSISDVDIEKYHRDGFFVLTRAMDPRHLEVLRNECERSIAEFDVEDDSVAGTTPVSGARPGESSAHKRYRVRDRFGEGAMAEIVFGEAFASICRATIGDTAYFFGNQFAIVGPGKPEAFGWRQASWAVKTKHKPFVTCVVALDDRTSANCAVSLLPYSQSGIREQVPEEESYRGPHQGFPVIVPAGTIVVFSSLVFYRLCSNTSGAWRRGYFSQYSSEPLKEPNGGLCNLAVPFLKEGERRSNRGLVARG